jgi:hypothetical protein
MAGGGPPAERSGEPVVEGEGGRRDLSESEGGAAISVGGAFPLHHSLFRPLARSLPSGGSRSDATRGASGPPPAIASQRGR